MIKLESIRESWRCPSLEQESAAAVMEGIARAGARAGRCEKLSAECN